MKSKLFPLRADPFSEWTECAVKQIGSHKSCRKGRNIYPVYLFPLICTFLVHR